jgi:hypothetical protein
MADNDESPNGQSEPSESPKSPDDPPVDEPKKPVDDDPEPLLPKPRLLIGSFALIILGFSSFAVFLGKNDVTSTAFVILGAILFYIALTGTPLSSLRVGEFETRFTQRRLIKNLPPEWKTAILTESTETKFDNKLVELDAEHREFVREALRRVATRASLSGDIRTDSFRRLEYVVGPPRSDTAEEAKYFFNSWRMEPYSTDEMSQFRQEIHDFTENALFSGADAVLAVVPNRSYTQADYMESRFFEEFSGKPLRIVDWRGPVDDNNLLEAIQIFIELSAGSSPNP